LAAAAGIPLSFAALAIVIVEAGGGHGTYVSARIFFPATIILATVAWQLTPLAWLIALVQIPLQILFARAASPGQQRRRRTVMVVLLHLALVGVSFFVERESFPIW
jgi:hypothetical protein